MNTLKNKLLSLDVFLDNEYLDKYIELVESNFYTKRETKKTQSHHIIPKCYFTLNSLDIDETPQNKVNLLYKDHVLAHCYIVLSAQECQFKYYNYYALVHLLGHRDFKDMRSLVESLDEVQMAYESSKRLLLDNNPMFRENVKQKHANTCKTLEFRQHVSEGMKLYRQLHSFSEEHRRKLSEAMKGNKNFGTGDTRSIGCYCIDSDGNRHEFHSYKDGTVWWFNNYKPFGERYVLITLQRKIKDSVENGTSFNGLTWYKIESEKSCAEAIESV